MNRPAFLAPAAPAALILLTLSVAPPARGQHRSDLKLEGARLDRFLRTKGTSLRGRDVLWVIPARALAKPRRLPRGQRLFVHRGIGLLIGAGSGDLARVKRAGGMVALRGRVMVPRRRPGPRSGPSLPPSLVVVRELRTRRKEHRGRPRQAPPTPIELVTAGRCPHPQRRPRDRWSGRFVVRGPALGG